jgi:predicted RNase H-like HicB family nuclease
MKLTAVFEPAKEGGYTCFVEEIPAAISQGETLREAKENLLDALKLVLECQRDLAEKVLSPNALREPIELAEAWNSATWSGTCAARGASFREGGAHTVWLNSSNRKIASVPRHREIKEGTVRGICRQLEIQRPWERYISRLRCLGLACVE